MDTNRRVAIGASYAILEKDGKFLITRRRNTGYQDGMYQVPAGHIETGELPTEALERELKEEVGITVLRENMKFAHVSSRPKHDKTGNRIDFFFRIHIWQGDIVNNEPDKCDDMKWVTFDELPENTTPHVRDALKASFGNSPFAELDLNYITRHKEYGTPGQQNTPQESH